MGLTIECSQCHAKFAGKEEFAGRRIRCPKCQNVFRVPANAAPAAEPVVKEAAVASTSAAVTTTATAAPAKPARPKNKYAGVAIDEWNVPDDFEYSVTDEVDESALRCVFCHAEMKAEDVLCLKCGYNRELGQKMSTKTGEEVLAEEQRNQALHSISFAGISVPKKALWIGSGVGAIVALALLLIAPMALVVLLALGGSLLLLAGHVGVIYVAFQESTMQGLLAWFVPIYWWVFVYSRWELAVLPFILWAIGVAMLLAAAAVGWTTMADDGSAAMLIVGQLARLA